MSKNLDKIGSFAPKKRLGDCEIDPAKVKLCKGLWTVTTAHSSATPLTGRIKSPWSRSSLRIQEEERVKNCYRMCQKMR